MSRIRRGGFTLLEAIVALAIVSIVCIGVLAAEGTALRAESTANTRLPLAALAEERVAALDAYDGPLDHLPDSLAVGTFAPPFTQVHWLTRTQPAYGHEGVWNVSVVARDGADSIVVATRRYRPSVRGAQ